MSELLTAAQMREIEEAAIRRGAVTGLELMERAGRGVVEAIFEEWPELAPAEAAGRGASPSGSPEYLEKDKDTRRAVVLCGPGNNGGDGFVVARLLRGFGWDVEVFLYGDPGKLPPDARVNYERWREMGEVEPMPESATIFPSRFPLHAGPELVVDALFGTGLTRPLSISLRTSLEGLSSLYPSSYTRWVAVDVPSGLCSDSGRWLSEDFSATRPIALTITFHAAKLGHYLSVGPDLCRKVKGKSIGLNYGRMLFFGSGPRKPAGKRFNEIASLLSGPGTPQRKSSGHKYDSGHALILSGGAGRSGAARLAARGALRIGAGLVTLGVPGSAQLEVAAQVTAVMLRRVEDAGALAEVLTDKRINALCLGPGLGTERASALVEAALGAAHRPLVVLDADALTAFADDPDVLFGMLHDRSVLTPHGGEFARLFPDIAERFAAKPERGPAYSKVDATREAAARAGAVVLYKGADTVIADPKGRCAVNAAVYDRTAPWLATAGAGDVLAGFICGLMARGHGAMEAAEIAAWLHVECARSFGPGLIAEDLPEELPKVFRALGA